MGKNVGGKVRTSGIAKDDCIHCHAEINAIIYLEENRFSGVELLGE